MMPELDQLLDFSWATKPTGIYFLLWHGEVAYVGKSLNVPVRIAQHRNNLIRHRRGLPPKLTNPDPVIQFDGVRVLLAEKDQLDALESHWIQRLNPPGNTRLNRAAKYDLRKHQFFNDLLALGKVRENKAKEATRLLCVPDLVVRARDRGLERAHFYRKRKGMVIHVR